MIPKSCSYLISTLHFCVAKGFSESRRPWLCFNSSADCNDWCQGLRRAWQASMHHMIRIHHPCSAFVIYLVVSVVHMTKTCIHVQESWPVNSYPYLVQLPTGSVLVIAGRSTTYLNFIATKFNAGHGHSPLSTSFSRLSLTSCISILHV